MNRNIVAIVLASVAAVALIGMAANGQAARTTGVVTGMQVPEKADNFRLVDNTGFAQELRRLVDVKAIVLVSQVNGDKRSRAAAAELEKLKAANPDVEFLMLNSSLSDGRKEIEAEAKTQGYSIPVMDDDLQLVGEQLGVTYAGEAFVLAPNTLKVLYHGPVDKAGAKKKAKGYLAAALADVKAGRAVAVTEVVGKGAEIAFPERAKRIEHASISYSKDVAPILAAKCVSCHQTGGIGPFAMTNYEVVKGFAPMIREAVRTRAMPPWHPDPVVGAFKGDHALASAEARTLVHWIEAGAMRGEGADPLSSIAAVDSKWPLGAPDLVLDIPEFKLPAAGAVDYQYPTVKNPLKEPRWVRAAAYRPGERQGVHHILGGYMSSPVGSAIAMGRWEASYGDFAVGGDAFVLPDDVGIELPADGGLSFQMHYTPFGKEAVDRSKVGFYFYPQGQKPRLIMHHARVIDGFIEIPPGAELHPETAYMKIDKDALLYAFFLHTHYRGRAARVELATPDGVRRTLINLPRYDFNWQRTYTFAKPVEAPAGSKVVVTYWYDNSVRNLGNPNPNVTVVTGEQSWEEMHYTSFFYRWKDETSDRLFPAQAPSPLDSLVGMLDDNLDGSIEANELHGRVGAALKPQFSSLDKDKSGGIQGPEIMGAVAFLRPFLRGPE